MNKEVYRPYLPHFVILELHFLRFRRISQLSHNAVSRGLRSVQCILSLVLEGSKRRI